MKKLTAFSPVFVFTAFAAFAITVAGCGKSVAKNGNGKDFGQIDEPGEGASPSPSGSPSPSPSGSPHPTPSGSPHPTPSGSPHPTPSGSPHPTPSGSPHPTPSGSPHPTPSGSPHPTPSGSPSPAPTPVPVVCDPSSVAPVLTYSVFTKDDTTITSSQLRKRVGASDACLDSSNVGLELASDRTRADIVSSHDLSLNCVTAPNGRIIYGRSLETKASSALGGIVKVSDIDLATDWKKVLAFSSGCAASSSNTTIERVCVPAHPCAVAGCIRGTYDLLPEADDASAESADSPAPVCTLKIKGTDARLNLATITQAQMTGVTYISVDIPSGSNFVGTVPNLKSAVFNGVQVLLARGIASENLFWNLPKGEKFTFDRTKFIGTVVSPKAAIGVSKNDGFGAFWSDSARVSGSSF